MGWRSARGLPHFLGATSGIDSTIDAAKQKHHSGEVRQTSQGSRGCGAGFALPEGVDRKQFLPGGWDRKWTLSEGRHRKWDRGGPRRCTLRGDYTRSWAFP